MGFDYFNDLEVNIKKSNLKLSAAHLSIIGFNTLKKKGKNRDLLVVIASHLYMVKNSGSCIFIIRRTS